MKQLHELKQGDTIYDIDFRRVRHYKYLCIHPTGHGNYHILIDECEEPVRIYYEKLQAILELGFETYDAALLALADKMEQSAKRIRTEIEYQDRETN